MYTVYTYKCMVLANPKHMSTIGPILCICCLQASMLESGWCLIHVLIA